jgi:prepilin-type N-terminal cleavage/methylation domain-containing protein/prepilin-type processing-associated H-X9-DG protein
MMSLNQVPLKPYPRYCTRSKGSLAFTLIELLVTISIIGILASLLLPSLSRSKQKAQGIYCLNNGRQMMIAITLYATDFHDLLMPNPDDATRLTGHNWCSGVAGRNGPAEFNPDLLKDPTRSLLALYIERNVSLFHCPGDKRTGNYQGDDPAMKGMKISAVRTFSMNQAVGTVCPGFAVGTKRINDAFPPHSGVPSMPVNGPWLNNNYSNLHDSPWATYGKLSNIGAPGPSKLWVLVDEDSSGLNDAAFAFGMELAKWIDGPGTYHNGGCGFAFADGHSESHKWLDLAAKLGNRKVIVDEKDRRDWLWMRDRTSAYVGPQQ